MKSSTFRKGKPLGGAIALVFICLAAVTANATDCYWYGDNDADPLDPSNYSSDAAGKSRLSVLPAAGSVVQIPAQAPFLRVDDDSVAFIASLGNVEIRDGSTLVIDISTNATVMSRFYFSSGTGTLVKRGKGTLFLAAPEVDTSDYFTSFIVEKGDLVFPQSGQEANAEYRHTSLVVSNGCKVVLDGGQSAAAFKLRITGRSIPVENPVGGFSGEGDIAYTNGSVACTLYAGGSDEPFTGTLSGDRLKLRVVGNLMLANGANTLSYDGANEMYLSDGTLGFGKFGNKSATATSSFGKLNSKIVVEGTGSSAFLCLATVNDGAQSTSRTIADYNTGTIGFDGGAYGNFTFSGNLYSVIGVTLVKELVLTGSNSTECTWSGDITGWSGSANYGAYYLTKRGTGTWKMAAVGSSSKKFAKLTGIGIENGTLAFLSLAEQGTMCSLGTAPASLLYGYPYKGATNGVPAVDYAIRLGNAANLAEEGCLEKRNTSVSAVTSCSTRHIAVTGRGRIRNAAASAALSWTGVKSIVPPEDANAVPPLSTLTLDGNGTGANTLSNITEEVGAAPLRMAKEGSATWTLGGTLGFTGGIDVREGTLNVDAALSASQPYVRCDGGATLNVTEGTVTATGLAVDAARGVGTVSGISFAASGTVFVTNAASYPVSIACDLGGCGNLGNIPTWTVEDAGGRRPGLVAVAGPAEIRILKRGTVITVR